MSDGELNGASITAKERLANIETLLANIDGKLDGKANQSDLIAVDVRVKDIELWRAGVHAEERVERIEKAAAKTAEAQRLDAIEAKGDRNAKAIAWGCGAGAVVVIGANLLSPLIIR